MADAYDIMRGLPNQFALVRQQEHGPPLMTVSQVSMSEVPQLMPMKRLQVELGLSNLLAQFVDWGYAARPGEILVVGTWVIVCIANQSVSYIQRRAS